MKAHQQLFMYWIILNQNIKQKFLWVVKGNNIQSYLEYVIQLASTLINHIGKYKWYGCSEYN